MNLGTRINGIQEQTNNGTVEKYCYNDNESNCDVYGGIYQWGEVVQYLNGASNTTSWNPAPTGNVQGICPTGWHLPSNAEWDVLVNSQGGSAIAGGPLKEAGTAHWQSPNTGATNNSGFTALPGGQRWNSGAFFYLTQNASLWASTENNSTNGFYRGLHHDLVGVTTYTGGKIYGSSSRCLKD
jgi:uncharacterized protein (TIGR02145 family)